MDARARILARVAEGARRARLPGATGDHPGRFPSDARAADTDPERLAARFAAELEALAGRIHAADDAAGCAALVARLLEPHGVSAVLAWSDVELEPPGLGRMLAEGGIRLVQLHLPPDPGGRMAALADLEKVGAGVTGALAGLADTGSIVVTSGAGRARLASLLPPVHVAVLSRRRLHGSLQAFLAAGTEPIGDASNLVIITGPSRTADIEMTITHGVHGPRELHVILVP